MNEQTTPAGDGPAERPVVQHTPGPWHAKHRQGGDAAYRTEIYSIQFGGIATCEWTPKNCGNGVTATYREANARLIAAAPQLLEALREVLEFQSAKDAPTIHHWGRWRRIADAASGTT